MSWFVSAALRCQTMNHRRDRHCIAARKARINNNMTWNAMHKEIRWSTFLFRLPEQWKTKPKWRSVRLIYCRFGSKHYLAFNDRPFRAAASLSRELRCSRGALDLKFGIFNAMFPLTRAFFLAILPHEMFKTIFSKANAMLWTAEPSIIGIATVCAVSFRPEGKKRQRIEPSDRREMSMANWIDTNLLAHSIDYLNRERKKAVERESNVAGFLFSFCRARGGGSDRIGGGDIREGKKTDRFTTMLISEIFRSDFVCAAGLSPAQNGFQRAFRLIFR